MCLQHTAEDVQCVGLVRKDVTRPATCCLLHSPCWPAFLKAAKPITAVILAHNGKNHAVQRIQAFHPRLHFAALAPQLQQQLLGWCCAAAARDEASPVRAAAIKAVGAVAAAPALCAVPNGE